MRIKQISIYNEFHCTGADCPASCCRGWRIPIDDAAYQKYIREPGSFGFLLRCAIVKKEDITAFRSLPGGRCPFWSADHLCGIQKKHSTDYMARVCVQFPRQLYNLGFFCEETLYLACPEAARLFLVSAEQERPFRFETIEGEPGYESNTTNDDKTFLDYLLKSREELLGMLADGCRFDSMALLDYARDAQDACIRGDTLPSPLDYDYKSTGGQRFVVDCTLMNSLFFNGFYHSALRTLSPLLYRLCQKYIRKIGRLSERDSKAADKKLVAMKENLYRKIPNLDRLLTRYYEYFLQTDFLNIFEDYSFTRNLLYGMAKANMLWLFFALYAEHKKNVTTEELAKVIAVYERRAPQIEDALKYININ